ncbi:hypothetical protein [Albidovulum sp.]|uniref:hypothetical protein n=1 Tax=Albidovulum sp. TaxID=1872424 RepID=UPI0034565CD4
MARALPLRALKGGLLTALSACAATPAARVYHAADPVGIGGDLVGFLVTVEGARTGAEAEDYATCVAAAYALEKQAGFARKVRVYVKEEGGVWSADAVYSVSPALPKGMRTIDAEVTVADCAERGIPTV